MTERSDRIDKGILKGRFPTAICTLPTAFCNVEFLHIGLPLLAALWYAVRFEVVASRTYQL